MRQHIDLGNAADYLDNLNIPDFRGKDELAAEVCLARKLCILSLVINIHNQCALQGSKQKLYIQQVRILLYLTGCNSSQPVTHV